MNKQALKSFFESDVMRIITLVISSFFSILVLTFSILTISEIYNDSISNAPYYLVWVFICIGFTKLVSILKDRSKINIIRSIVLFAFDCSLAVLVIFAKYNIYIFSLSAGLYCLSIVLSRVLKIVQKHSIRDIILNALIILCVVLLALALFRSVPDDTIDGVILIECLFIALTAFAEVATIAFAQLRAKVLFKIVVKTFALEILFGLFTLIISFSLILSFIEPDIKTFADGLWYCFAVVTTIGFGDIVAETFIGRILTIILGIYGVLIVAVLTSIIVNFYNETSGKNDAKELKEIKKEVEKNNKPKK